MDALQKKKKKMIVMIMIIADGKIHVSVLKNIINYPMIALKKR